MAMTHYSDFSEQRQKHCIQHEQLKTIAESVAMQEWAEKNLSYDKDQLLKDTSTLVKLVTKT